MSDGTIAKHYKSYWAYHGPANCSPLLLLAVQSVAITGDPLGTINLFVYKWWTSEYKGSVSGHPIISKIECKNNFLLATGKGKFSNNDSLM